VSGSNHYTQRVNKAEGQCFDKRHIAVLNGEADLLLTADQCPSSGDGVGTSASLPYTGAAITTRPHFSFTYGVVETRMWVTGPGGNATLCPNWTSFWINSIATSPQHEFDLAECLSGKFAVHANPGSTSAGNNGNIAISNGWHIFSADWEPGSVTVYYDLFKIGTLTTNLYDKPMFVLFEQATHGVDNVTAPDVMRIDYVRAWSR
jgi:beta-glucanase (GH16 family)